MFTTPATPAAYAVFTVYLPPRPRASANDTGVLAHPHRIFIVPPRVSAIESYGFMNANKAPLFCFINPRSISLLRPGLGDFPRGGFSGAAPLCGPPFSTLRAPSARRDSARLRRAEYYGWFGRGGFSTTVQFCDILGDHRSATPVRSRPPFRFTSSSSHFVLVAFRFSLFYVRSHVQASCCLGNTSCR